jgi:hypothetical protein
MLINAQKGINLAQVPRTNAQKLAKKADRVRKGKMGRGSPVYDACIASIQAARAL